MKIEEYVVQTVRHQLASYLPLGHFVDEMLRVVDTIQFDEQHGEVCLSCSQKGE